MGACLHFLRRILGKKTCVIVYSLSGVLVFEFYDKREAIKKYEESFNWDYTLHSVLIDGSIIDEGKIYDDKTIEGISFKL